MRLYSGWDFRCYYWLVFSIRYVWLPFVGMLLSVSYIYDYCPVNWPEKRPEDALKLLTYNTEFLARGEKNAEGRYPILDYLVASEADIICLQEGVAPKNLKSEYVDSIMAKAGYHIRRLHDGKAEPQFVYSSLPILSVHRIAYESTTNGSLAVELLYGQDTVLLVNNHLESYKLTPEDMVVVDLQGNKVEGKYNPSSDTATHMVLYNRFPEIGGIVHTHSTWATSWAQAGRSIPCYGTTHADYIYQDVPCVRNLTKQEIDEAYELNTGILIADEYEARGIDYIATPAVLCKNHGPFTWGKDAHEAVHNAVVLEEVARMAANCEMINPKVAPAPIELQNKHYYRKHGANAYYGQK